MPTSKIAPKYGSRSSEFQTYLSISTTQISKYTSIRNKYRARRTESRSKYVKFYSDLQKDTYKALGDNRSAEVNALLPTYNNDVEQIRVSVAASRGGGTHRSIVSVPLPDLDEPLTKLSDLASTPDQKRKIGEILLRYQKRLKDAETEIMKARDDEEQDLRKILTSEQRSTITELQVQGALDPKTSAWQQLFGDTSLPSDTIAQSVGMVVKLVLQNPDGTTRKIGYGFVVANNVVATSLQLVDGGAQGFVSVGGSDTAIPLAGLLAVDVKNDLALLKVPTLSSSVLPLGDSTKVAVGEAVTVFAGSDQQRGTLRTGKVEVSETADGKLSVSPVTTPSFSGKFGLVFNGTGEVIGIALSPLTDGLPSISFLPVASLQALLGGVLPPKL